MAGVDVWELGGRGWMGETNACSRWVYLREEGLAIRGETTMNGLVGGVCGGFVFVDGGGSMKEVVGRWTEIGRTGTGVCLKRGATSHA